MLKVELVTHTPDPERVVAAAAKMCYSDAGAERILDGLTEEKAADFVAMLTEIGHESPIEHASFTFAVEGVSRTLLAQITRHRIASFSVQSQRYVKKSDMRHITPPEIAGDADALALFEKSMADAARAYDDIAAILEKKHERAMLAEGLDPKEAKKAAKKAAIEDARFVLPNACETKMILTMNARSLQNFFQLRCCNRAQWEIRELAWEMLTLCRQAAPTLFLRAGPGCCAGGCTEGKMNCGRANEVRERWSRAK